MNASLRTLRPARTSHDVARIIALSLVVFGVVSFGVNDSNTLAVWLFRFLTFGPAIALFFYSRDPSGAKKGSSPEFKDGLLVLAGQTFDPRDITAAAMSPRDPGGIVHLWLQDQNEAVITADSKLFAILCGALRPSLLDVCRSYQPSGAIRGLARLDVDREGLGFPTDWVRGQGMTRVERVAWEDVQRVYVQDGFVVLQRMDGQLLGPGVSIAPDLVALTIEEIEAMRAGPSTNPVPNEVLAALPRLAGAPKDRDPAPYRDAPDIADADVLVALARGPVETRGLAADVLVARGVISVDAAAFVRRGLDKKRTLKLEQSRRA